jgi:homeobox-leucine zipper protein
MKTQHEHHENTQLRSENEKLRSENMRYREALNNASCPNCGGPTTLGEMSFDEQQLRMENARLREEIDRISGIAAKYVGKPLLSFGPSPLSSISRSNLDLAVGSYGVQPNIGPYIYGSSSGREIGNRSLVGPTEGEKPMVVELAVAAMEELVRMAQLGEPLGPHIRRIVLIF